MVDTKLTALTATTTLASTDLMYAILDAAGTPLDRKVTVASMKTILGVIGTADSDVLNKTLDNCKTVQFNSQIDNGSKTASFNVTCNDGQKQKVTLTANTMTMTLVNPTSVADFLLVIVNGGLATLTWAATTGSIYAVGGTAPTLTSSGIDIIGIHYDGTNFFILDSLNFQVIT